MTAVLGGRMERRDVADGAGERKLTCSTIRNSPLERFLSSRFDAETNMRTVANQLASGYTIRMADTGAQKVQWQLRYSEPHRWRTSFDREPVRSRRRSAEHVHFLDPTDNLLMWSEDWTQTVWTADPLLQVTGGVQDPFGGNCRDATHEHRRRQRNRSFRTPADRVRSCTASACMFGAACPRRFSWLWRRPGRLSLTAVTTSASWMRVTASGSLSVQQDGIGFGVQLPAGVQVDAFGAQVEAQPAAGLYKKTIDLGGVYSSTRFSSDLLAFAATAPNQNSCQIGLISNLN